VADLSALLLAPPFQAGLMGSGVVVGIGGVFVEVFASFTGKYAAFPSAGGLLHGSLLMCIVGFVIFGLFNMDERLYKGLEQAVEPVAAVASTVSAVLTGIRGMTSGLLERIAAGTRIVTKRLKLQKGAKKMDESRDADSDDKVIDLTGKES
jgi:hypothetical protein